MGATLFDLGGPIAPAPKAPAAPRGGRRKTAASTPAQPPASAIHHAAPTPADAPTVDAPAVTTDPEAPTVATVDAPVYCGLPKPLPPFAPDDASFYADSYRLLRASPAELAIVEERHRAAGFGMAPSPDALAGAISACAPRERPAGPWVTCECGAEMLEEQHAEHLARATRPATWSLHREFMRLRAQQVSP